MRDEYDFTNGVRGKYAARLGLGKGSTVVVLAPDVAKVFKTAKAVNAALRNQLKKRPRARRRPGL